MIRIANGQGFWGDSLEAPVEQVRRGPIDYLTLDYLAEITMSILQKQRSRDPKAGYARDFVDMIARVLPDLVERRIRVIANAGGVNPAACRDAVLAVAKRQGIDVAVATVAGDDIMGKLDEFIGRGVALKNMETGEPLSSIRDRVQSANVYFGAFPVAEALGNGAQIVITGRVTDTGLALAPMIHEFGWKVDDWDRLSAGTIAGHTVECGAQCTGGNCQIDWESIPNMADIGYPIIEAEPDGTFVITKHAGTGGRVTVASVKEQLLYEMGDPREYITPDCVADFTTIQLEQCGPDRVRYTGIRGRPATPFYKVSVSYAAGFKAIGSLVYAWPDAYKKARAADRIIRERLDRLGLTFDEIRTEFVGANATQGIPSAEPSPEVEPQLAEVLMRIGVRSNDRAAVDRFTKEIAPLALNGPPVVTGFGSGRPKVEEIVAYWPALIPKTEVAPEVTLWRNEN
ncbi:MAG TPA: acyclic terpene utilization AtuA family protein [Bryobacteraceae bacterium]|nr:acyclic terpene utilization AtuA family protein [Bryobacteraceae bacterium]